MTKEQAAQFILHSLGNINATKAQHIQFEQAVKVLLEGPPKADSAVEKKT